MRWFRRKKVLTESVNNGPEIAKTYDVKLTDIKITAQFAATRPGKRKMEAKQNIYKATGRFANPCVLVTDNTLIDGYCTYVLAKRMRLSTVPCIYIGDEWRPVEALTLGEEANTEANASQ